MKDQVLSIKQMQELIDMGIDTSNASCIWWNFADLGFALMFLNDGHEPITIEKMKENHGAENVVPAFTLQDIIELLPPCIEGEPIEEFETSYSLNIDFSSKEISYYDYIWDRELISFDYNNLLDGAFEMFKWCKENKYI